MGLVRASDDSCNNAALRDVVAKWMTPADLREAQRRAQTPSTTSTDTALNAQAPVAADQNDDVTLHDLQLLEGPPDSDFFFTAMADALPDGNVSLAPGFEPDVIAYRAGVSQPLLTIMASAAWGMRMSATGTAADGAVLRPVNRRSFGEANDPFVNIPGNREHGALSVTLSGLVVGEHTIRIRIATSSVEKTYTVVVTREP